MMLEMSSAVLLQVGTIALSAGIIRGFSGFGFALVGVPLLSMILAPPDFVPLIFSMQLVAAVPGLRQTLREADGRQILPLLAGGVPGTWAGLWLLGRLEPVMIGLAIAAAVTLVAVFLFSGWRLQRRLRPAEILGLGTLSGILNGSAGLPGPPVIVAQLVSSNSDAMVRSNLIVFFTLLAGFGLGAIGLGGGLKQDHLYLTAAAAPFLLAGTWIGIRLFDNARMRLHYRRLSTCLLFVIGLAKLFESVLKFT